MEGEILNSPYTKNINSPFIMIFSRSCRRRLSNLNSSRTFLINLLIIHVVFFFFYFISYRKIKVSHFKKMVFAMSMEKFSVKINAVITKEIVNGDIVEIKDRSKDGCYKYRSTDENKTNAVFSAHPKNFYELPSDVFGNFLLGIKCYDKRFNLCFDEEWSSFILSLKVKDMIVYTMQGSDERTICVIKCIGPMKNYGTGWYFALEYVGGDHISYVSENKLQALKKHCHISYGTVACADELFQLTDGEKVQYIMKDFKKDKKGKVQSTGELSVLICVFSLYLILSDFCNMQIPLCLISMRPKPYTSILMRGRTFWHYATTQILDGFVNCAPQSTIRNRPLANCANNTGK